MDFIKRNCTQSVKAVCNCLCKIWKVAKAKVHPCYELCCSLVLVIKVIHHYGYWRTIKLIYTFLHREINGIHCITGERYPPPDDEMKTIRTNHGKDRNVGKPAEKGGASTKAQPEKEQHVIDKERREETIQAWLDWIEILALGSVIFYSTLLIYKGVQEELSKAQEVREEAGRES